MPNKNRENTKINIIKQEKKIRIREANIVLSFDHGSDLSEDYFERFKT